MFLTLKAELVLSCLIMNFNAQLLSYKNNPLGSKCRIYFQSETPEIIHVPGFIGFRVAKFLVFYVLFCRLLFVFSSAFGFRYCCVGLFSTFKFDCSFGICCLSFKILHLLANVQARTVHGGICV